MGSRRIKEKIAVNGALGYRTHDETISFTEYTRLNMWTRIPITLDSDSDCTQEPPMSLRTKPVTPLSTVTATDSD